MVDVTQADRDAAAKFPYIPEQTHLLEAFAAHREAGFEAGRRAGLEEAVDAARGTNADMLRGAGQAYLVMLAAIRARIGDER